MPNSDLDLNPTLINKMVYLDQCIREAQRLFPTVPLIGRTSNETINLNGYDIPSKLPIFVGIRQIHRREDYYGSDAHLYKPERFKPNENHPNKDQQGMYLPFSLGPRNCIGKQCKCKIEKQTNKQTTEVRKFALKIFLFLIRLQLCHLYNEIGCSSYPTKLSPYNATSFERAQSKTVCEFSIP